MYPVLIVGQGLAGTNLALTLIKQQVPVVIYSSVQPGSASQVAAGIFNPLTGRNLQLTWMADIIFPYLHNFYSEWQQNFSEKFFYPMANIRPLHSIEELNKAKQYLQDDLISKWISPRLITHEDLNIRKVVAPLGAFETLHSGIVDVPLFLKCAEAYFNKLGCLKYTAVNEGDITFSNESGIFQDQNFHSVVYATGAMAMSGNTAGIPGIAPLKGEILILESEGKEVTIPGVINRNGYLAPKKAGLFWAGSTYNHNYSHIYPEVESKEKILKNAASLVNFSLDIKNHLAGIRPSSKDRRPIVGSIPGKSKSYIFNGLGTKGVSLAPYFAKLLADLIVNDLDNLPPEVNPGRFYK